MCRQTSRTAAVFITETLGRSFDTVAHLASYAGLAPWPDAQDHPSGASTSRTRVTRDPNGAWYTSGIRLGTPALTSRGFTTSDMDEVAAMITDVLKKTTPTTTNVRQSRQGLTVLGNAPAAVAATSRSIRTTLYSRPPHHRPSRNARRSNRALAPNPDIRTNTRTR